MSNNLDPDQARHYVGPDLVPKCLQWYQQTTKLSLLAGKGNSILLKIVLFFFYRKFIHPIVLLNHEVAEIQDAESSSSRRCVLLRSNHSQTDHGAVTDAKRRVGIQDLFIL